MSARLLFIYAFLIIVLLIRFALAPEKESYVDGQEVSFVAKLRSAPKISGRLQRFSIAQAGFPIVFITTNAIPEYSFGQSLRIVGKIEKRVIENGKTLDTILMPKITLQNDKQDDLLFLLRDGIQDFYKLHLSQIQSALLTGIVFGIKEDIPRDFSDALADTGVLHVVAASGMNVSIVGGVFLSTLQVFFKRRVALLFTILGIGLYALLAGLQPSIVRAAIMGSIAFIGLTVGRQYTALHVLFLTGFFMLLFDLSLITDVGFQLSFLATFGILCIKPLFAKGKKDILSLFREDFFTTLSAQLTTFPILLLTFGSFGLISLLVNTLVLWSVPFIMILGGISGILGSIWQPLGIIVLYLTLPFLFYFETTIRIFALIPFKLTFAFSIFFVIGYYMLLLAFLMAKFIKK